MAMEYVGPEGQLHEQGEKVLATRNLLETAVNDRLGPRPHVPNDRLRHRLIGYARASRVVAVKLESVATAQSWPTAPAADGRTQCDSMVCGTRPGRVPPVGAGLPARRQPASLPSCHRPGRTGPGPVAARPGREGYPGPFWADGGGTVHHFSQQYLVKSAVPLYVYNHAHSFLGRAPGFCRQATSQELTGQRPVRTCLGRVLDPYYLYGVPGSGALTGGTLGRGHVGGAAPIRNEWHDRLWRAAKRYTIGVRVARFPIDQHVLHGEWSKDPHVPPCANNP